MHIWGTKTILWYRIGTRPNFKKKCDFYLFPQGKKAHTDYYYTKSNTMNFFNL